ncbi:S1 RNA-binding domain-containing protein [Cytobacillus sp. Hz8]|uniref:CvfB family protein n=1 Tax=Cytobacillus sp. Hz8 TaxID=3347168 RepID=UPI0035DEB0F4
MAIIDFIGQVTELTVARVAQFGYFLTDGTEDVLLHANETDKVLEEGEKVEVFLYMDNEGRVAATTSVPTITVGAYDWAKVSDVKPGVGVFVDIGIQKEMLLGEEDLPKHQSVWPEKDDLLYITLRVSRNHRIYVKLATDTIFEEKRIHATREQFNKSIQGHIYRTAKVGSWIFSVEGFKGFIHESQRKVEPRLGEKVESRIIDVKPDGTINVSLIPRKHEAIDDDAERIYQYLMSRNGAMPYGDKSRHEDIEERFHMSKGAFKRALGKLIKEGKIYQEEGWTYSKNR